MEPLDVCVSPETARCGLTVQIPRVLDLTRGPQILRCQPGVRCPLSPHFLFPFRASPTAHPSVPKSLPPRQHHGEMGRKRRSWVWPADWLCLLETVI